LKSRASSSTHASTPSQPKAENEEKIATGGKGGKKKKSASKDSTSGPALGNTPTSLPLTSILSGLPSLSHASLWKTICHEVKTRFLFDLALEEKEKKGLRYLNRIPALRGFCRAAGLQILARDYDFSLKGPVFQPSDIISFVPIAKSLTPRAVDAKELSDSAKVQHSQGKLQIAAELLSEALSISQQVYGPIHPEIASCLSTLSLVYYQSGEIAQAISHQERAVVISERVYGLDNPETYRLYVNLAVLLYALEKVPLALRFITRARYLAQVVFGPSHPETISADSNTALMLQSLGDFQTAHQFLRGVCVMEENFFGSDNVFTASGYHDLAKSCGFLGEYKEGLQYERLAYGIYSKKLGTEDIRTKESSLWLSQLTQNAVITEKTKKKLPWSQGAQVAQGAASQKAINSPAAQSSASGSSGSASKSKNKKKK